MTAEGRTPAPITVSVAPTFQDFVGFSLRFGFLRAKAILFFGTLWLIVLLIAAYGIQSLDAKVPPGPVKHAATAAILLVPVFVLVVLPTSAYLAAHRQWRTSPSLREPREYTFSDDGIRVVGATAASFVAWSNVTTAKRVGQQVLLATGQQFFLIPLWAFGTSEDEQRFRELVSSRVAGCRL